jgi:hypothetical protein
MRPIFTDGVYALSFSSLSDPAGEASTWLAIVRSGRVMGSDPCGCVLSGQLVVADNCPPHFEGSLTVPPDGELITGLRAGPHGLSLPIRAAVAQDGNGVPRFVADVDGRALDVSVSYVGRLPNEFDRMSRSA